MARWSVTSTLGFFVLASFLASTVFANGADDCSACHSLAYCDPTGDPVCECQPGTIDTSGSENGTACSKNAYTVRFVVDRASDSENPTATLTHSQGMAKCPTTDPPVQGYFVRSIDGMEEVNCLYPTEPSEVPSEFDNNETYFVEPAIYAWTLPTTGAPLTIPPTGLTVESVSFNTSCAESGCWVIRGTMTTGEAFNDHSAFNTWFLPQADITDEHPQGDLSYDYDYSAVDWTFSPANNPCESFGFAAGAQVSDRSERLHKVSTCCITDTDTDFATENTLGLVANYRPTEAFIDWAGELGCDANFTSESGTDDCYKLYKNFETRASAAAKCEAVGGFLATIENADQQAIVSEMLKREWGEGATVGYYEDGDFLHVYRASAWIGLKRNQSAWEWDSGSASGFRDWFSGEGGGADPDEECVMVESWKGEWYERKCENRAQYICQFTPPTWDTDCILHTVQRPKYTAPKQEASKCWNVYGQAEIDADSATPFLDAEAFCEDLGGYLARPMDDDEVLLMKRLLDRQGVKEAWIGATDWQTEGVYTWGTNGTSIDSLATRGQSGDFDPWRSGDWCQGFIDGSADNDYDCVAAVAFDGGKWCTKDCAVRARFICEVPRGQDTTCQSDQIANEDGEWDIAFPLQYNTFLAEGKFKGMNASPGVTAFEVEDPFFGQFSFEIQLDEVELRSKAGQLRGTVGVEHTVDTFLGLANFRPTGTVVLDTSAVQVNLHLEKTSFFTVSTHGENEYTFLEYVNMRLVQILDEDKNFAGTDEVADRTVRTDTTGNAAYIQVTFTMDARYQPNMESGGLIPTDSVRAGMGTFFDNVQADGHMEHVCVDYLDGDDAMGLTTPTDSTGTKTQFDYLKNQGCGPQAAMCSSPSTVPDQFVSFNIPLGFEVFDGMASSDLSNNIFVDFVVNAVDNQGAGTSGMNDDPDQVKTTLTASIPIVAGGINIFCDGFTAKTDLKDVADVDIVVGTANSTAELSRLPILTDIASTDLASVDSSEINTPSIESALMTLVIKGNHSYFRDVNTNTDDYTMELDDVITIHIMEDGQASSGPKDTIVQNLLSTAGEDNTDSATGLLTNGYALNGAFWFWVDRSDGEAHLEPSDDLLDACPFNPPRPSSLASPLETCVIRRDVKERDYPVRPGAASATAMEILAAASPKDSTFTTTSQISLTTTSDESDFIASILGDNTYARELAVSFAEVIRSTYELNGRYRRAYWINPGYEWTPTQTAGTSIFSVSQKIYLFALISLDENWGRRRAMLQTSTDALQENAAGMNAASISYGVTPKSLMANAFNVPDDRVAIFTVTMLLTTVEACMSRVERQEALRKTLEDYLTEFASSFKTVQVTKMQEFNLDSVQCGARRSLRRKLLEQQFSEATAEVEVLIVFSEGAVSKFNDVGLMDQPGIQSVEKVDVSAKVDIDPEYGCKENCGTAKTDSKSSDNTALIAGVCGGVAAALVIGAVAVFFMRRTRKQEEPVAAVQMISVNDLKAQLSQEV